MSSDEIALEVIFQPNLATLIFLVFVVSSRLRLLRFSSWLLFKQRRVITYGLRNPFRYGFTGSKKIAHNNKRESKCSSEKEEKALRWPE